MGGHVRAYAYVNLKSKVMLSSVMVSLRNFGARGQADAAGVSCHSDVTERMVVAPSRCRQWHKCPRPGINEMKSNYI